MARKYGPAIKLSELLQQKANTVCKLEVQEDGVVYICPIDRHVPAPKPHVKEEVVAADDHENEGKNTAKVEEADLLLSYDDEDVVDPFDPLSDAFQSIPF